MKNKMTDNLRKEVKRILLYDYFLSSDEAERAFEIGRFDSTKHDPFVSHLSADQIAERLADNLKLV